MKRVLLVLASVLFMAFGAMAQTNGLSEAQIQGRQLAQKLLEISPSENLTNTGIVEIRRNGTNITYPVNFKTIVTDTNWLNIYKVSLVDYDNEKNFGNRVKIVTVIHTGDEPNRYIEEDRFEYGIKSDGEIAVEPAGGDTRPLSNRRTMVPFAGSDFWIADLGLEFFHWPEQKILKHETKRTRSCAVLESTNPNPSPGGYSRVVTWIDNESLAIIWAEAYDTNGKLLKVFNPKKVKKVNGQWELEDMEIRNQQTGSRTSIKFDLNAK